MRVIAGEFKSRKLLTLSGDNTRPTQDKVKEAIFSKIGPYFQEGIVLDLFAGSGAFGIECLSRGIDKAYFNDNNYSAIKIIKENISNLKLEQQSVITKNNYKRTLENLQNCVFDIVFIDPPYALKVHNDIIKYLIDHKMLKRDGWLIIESSSDEQLLDNYQGLEKISEKKYGITKISYYKLK